MYSKKSFYMKNLSVNLASTLIRGRCNHVKLSKFQVKEKTNKLVYT